MYCHLAMFSASLGRPVLSPAMSDRRHGLAVLCIDWFAGGTTIVEVIALPAASENLCGHHLRTHVPRLIAQEKSVHAVALRPESGVWNSNRQTRSPGGTAQGEGINAFSSDHARVRQLPRTFFDNGAFEGATESAIGQQEDKNRRCEKCGTHRQRVGDEESGKTFVVFFGPGRQRFV